LPAAFQIGTRHFERADIFRGLGATLTRIPDGGLVQLIAPDAVIEFRRHGGIMCTPRGYLQEDIWP